MKHWKQIVTYSKYMICLVIFVCKMWKEYINNK